MPNYRDGKGVISGVPLGGIGAGKLEILPNGLFNGMTFLNNWSNPVKGDERYPGILGYHLAFYARKKSDRGKGSGKTWLLQTDRINGWMTADRIAYSGSFPSVVLDYHLPGCPFEVRLEGYSAWSVSSAKDSSLPCAYFRLSAKNRSQNSYDVGFLFIGRNLSGEWCVGRSNQVTEDDAYTHLRFFNKRAAVSDPRNGHLLFSFGKKDWKLSFHESWNAVTKNFHFDAKEIRLSALDLFSRGQALPNSYMHYEAQSENHELCGAVAAHSEITPSSGKEWNFQAVWHYPRHGFGHSYEKRFKDVMAVQKHASIYRAKAEKKAKRFRTLVHSMPFPEWFCDALCNSLSPFFASTWHTRDQRFAFYEAPVVCPLMGTLDVGFYGSIPVSYFFPDLEKSQLRQFAKAQRPDGYIPHDLGKNRIDVPSNGTTFLFWKDLNPKFVLMAYRDGLWSKDGKFLEEMYPHIKKALNWCFGRDFDGNGLPDHEGADQTFDLWDFRGTNPYTGSLYLAALLAAGKMAQHLGDKRFERECAKRFERGSKSFESELWNGEYFGQHCALSQLNGQWYADLLDLGSIVDEKKVRTAIQSISRRNAAHSTFGLVNSALADGNPDRSNSHAENIWFGMNYAWSSLALMRGFSLKVVLKPARLLWDNTVYKQKNPWNQPDMVDSRSGRFLFGDAYYRNMAIWAIPIGYSKMNKKTAGVLKALKAGY